MTTTQQEPTIESSERHEQTICELRKLLRPSKVTPGMPNWFRLAFLRNCPGQCRYGTSAWSILDAIRRRGGDWLDHEGQCQWRDRRAFVSEPYAVTAGDVADQLGCHWELTPNSWHFPGSTLRIVFFEKDKIQ